MLNKTTCWAVLLYGALLILLGVYGYVEAGSKVSLFTGVGFGVGLVLCSFSMFSEKKAGGYVALALTALLTVTFLIRVSATGKPLPAILATLSGAMLLFLLVKVAKWKKG